MRSFLYSDASPPENLPAGAALPTSVALPAGARDQDEVGRRNSVGKAKGKGKKSDSSPPTETDLEVKHVGSCSIQAQKNHKVKVALKKVHETGI